MKVVKMDSVPKEVFINPIFTGRQVTRQVLLPESKEYEVNHSTPRPKGRGLLEVHPERRLLPRLERRGFAPSNG